MAKLGDERAPSRLSRLDRATTNSPSSPYVYSYARKFRDERLNEQHRHFLSLHWFTSLEIVMANPKILMTAWLPVRIAIFQLGFGLHHIRQQEFPGEDAGDTGSQYLRLGNALLLIFTIF